MAVLAAQIKYGQVIPMTISMFLFGIASGAAMIPYSVIKEVNPDNVKGSATGAMNFLVFGITAAIGPIFAQMIGKTLGMTNPVAHFQESGFFWMTCCLAAGMVGFLLRETGHAAVHPAVSDSPANPAA
jgi:MFS family permease